MTAPTALNGSTKTITEMSPDVKPMPSEKEATGKLTSGQKVSFKTSIKNAFSTMMTKISNFFKAVFEAIKATPSTVTEGCKKAYNKSTSFVSHYAKLPWSKKPTMEKAPTTEKVTVAANAEKPATAVTAPTAVAA